MHVTMFLINKYGVPLKVPSATGKELGIPVKEFIEAADKVRQSNPVQSELYHSTTTHLDRFVSANDTVDEPYPEACLRATVTIILC